MEYIDLQTGYMLLAFRSQQEVARAKTLFESRGLQTVHALSFEALSETNADSLVKQVEHEGKTLFWNYSNQSAAKLFDSAKASLGSALQLSNAISGISCDYLLIYEKEKPLLKSQLTYQGTPALPVI